VKLFIFYLYKSIIILLFIWGNYLFFYLYKSILNLSNHSIGSCHKWIIN
jgi:hypothetical protein